MANLGMVLLGVFSDRVVPVEDSTLLEKNAETFEPTAGMKTAASRALRWKDDGKATGAGTPVGWGRATDIVSGNAMSLDIVKRMYSFFSRHEVDKQGKDFDNLSNPSNGRIMWDAWGGDAGFTWSRNIVERLAKYAPGQPHDSRGRFASGSGSGSIAVIDDHQAEVRIFGPGRSEVEDFWATRYPDSTSDDMRAAAKAYVAHSVAKGMIADGADPAAIIDASFEDLDWAAGYKRALEPQNGLPYRLTTLVHINETGQMERLLGAHGPIEMRDWVKEQALNPAGVADAFTPEKLGEVLQGFKGDSWAVAGTEHAKQLLAETAANRLVSQWAHTSNDTSVKSLAIQEVAAKQFGIDGYAKWEDVRGVTDSSLSDKVFKDIQLNSGVYSSFLQNQYNLTQSFFSRQGVSSVKLFRGYDNAKLANAIRATGATSMAGQLQQRPLSSWSTTKNTALAFRGGGNNSILASAQIDVKNILATPFTGVGCLSETEMVTRVGALDGIAELGSTIKP